MNTNFIESPKRMYYNKNEKKKTGGKRVCRKEIKILRAIPKPCTAENAARKWKTGCVRSADTKYMCPWTKKKP